ncbi:hypothetical protein CYMTET_27858 [Cymbomonas tetramitiformis]|uniref:Uncharacterized protein n=1 Tax=Cymbomonas tetramitiformis TaxID=36881 RepID=A0AAE0KWG8_9CHLO|nr:hypothetical protein CYMTET_27858 [Cymbomonas tetramitiformis]
MLSLINSGLLDDGPSHEMMFIGRASAGGRPLYATETPHYKTPKGKKGKAGKHSEKVLLIPFHLTSALPTVLLLCS